MQNLTNQSYLSTLPTNYYPTYTLFCFIPDKIFWTFDSAFTHLPTVESDDYFKH